LAKGYAALVGESFVFKISEEGIIKDVGGVDALRTRMLKKLNLPEGERKVEIEKNFKENFNNETLKEQMAKMMAIYPQNPIGIGESWTKKVLTSKGVPALLDNTWTLKERKNGIAIVEVSSIIEPNPEAQPTKIGNVTLSYNVKGEQKGTIEIKEATGLITGGKIIQKLSGEIKMVGNPQAPQGLVWPMSIESIIKIEPLK
jgi:hypothetical protein